MYSTQENKIKVKTDIGIYFDVCKMAWFIVNNWYNKMTNIANKNRKAEINSKNVKLAEFDVCTVTSLTNNVYKTCCK